MSKKSLIIIGVFVYVCLAVPAVYGLVSFFTSDVTGGNCVAEFTVDKYHRTQGVVHITSSVISLDDTQVIVPNMTCEKFKKEPEVNAFRYTHPTFSLYSILMLVGTLTVIIVWFVAGFCNWLCKQYEKRQARRQS